MTPTDKAKELVDKYRNEFKWVEIDYPVDLYRDTKQCALIAVDEILEIASSVRHYSDMQVTEYGYWNQVKEEISKL